MVGGAESLKNGTELPMPDELKSIPLLCWQEVNLSTIWIPSNLLPHRYEPRNTQSIRGIFHTLENKDLSKHKESFSIYVTSDNEEIFYSDDENLHDEYENKSLACNFVSSSNENKINETLQNKVDKENKLYSLQNYNVNNELHSGDSFQNFRSNFQSLNETQLRKTESYISLNEILDDSPEFKISNFSSNFSRDNTSLDTQQKLSKQKKSKNKKMKKQIGLNEFLSDYTEADFQEANARDYFNKVMSESHDNKNIHAKSKTEFPDLTPNEVKFVHSEKSSATDSQSTSKSYTWINNVFKQTEDIIINSDKIGEKMSKEHNEEISSTCEDPDNTCRTLVFENIPIQTSEEDIQCFLFGLGEIESFSIKPVGEFLKATVKFRLGLKDIEWIIECFNETEPFGASTGILKCYKQP